MFINSPRFAASLILALATMSAISLNTLWAADESGVFPAYPKNESTPPPAKADPGVPAKETPGAAVSNSSTKGSGSSAEKPEASGSNASVTVQHAADDGGGYKVQRGDVLTISVWKETDLQSEVVVRPDGGISIPLIGELQAAGQTIEQIRAVIDQRLRKYIPDPVVTVAVKQISGNRIYVVGKVNRPGDFPLTGSIDVMQALGLAGGTTPFASLNHIRVLRREDGKQTAIPFRYDDIEGGRALEQNILLHSGDTVVVP